MTTTVANPETFGGTKVPAEWQNQIVVSAARWGISPAVLAAQLDAESSFNPHAVSAAGAVGIAQFLPSTARSLGVNPYNPSAAIDGMAQLDAKYVKEFGSIDLALAAYNAGPAAVSKSNGVPAYAETQNYVKKILAAAGESLATNGAGLGVVDVGLSNPLPAVSHVVETLLSAHFWQRLGLGALGFLVLAIGLYFMMEKESGSFKPVRKIVGNLG
jgi:hypothetical protein